MDNNNLSNMGHGNLQLSIKLPKNSDVNVIISPPYQADVVIGMCACNLNCGTYIYMHQYTTS